MTMKLRKLLIKCLFMCLIIFTQSTYCHCLNRTRVKRTIKRPDKIEAFNNYLLPVKGARETTRFFLYTRNNPNKGQELVIDNEEVLYKSSFNPNLPIKFVISGWLDNRYFAKWTRMSVQSLLIHGDYNVIYCAWKSIKELFVAAMMIKIYSIDLAQLIIFLKNTYGIRGEFIHCIGHSLGAFLCGFAGDVTFIGRITVLDAGPRPWYQTMPESERINRFQAAFVDVIHSDFNPVFSLGLTIPMGDIDFFPNAGTPQPGCIRDKLVQGIKEIKDEGPVVGLFQWVRYLLFCSHYRAHEWFFESVRNHKCTFVAVKCPSHEMFMNGECGCDQSPHSCAIMGIDADRVLTSGISKHTPQGQWFIKTSDFIRETDLHCAFQYQIQVQLGNFFQINNGTLRLIIHSSSGTYHEDRVRPYNDVFISGRRIGLLTTRKSPLGIIYGVTVSWDNEDNYSFKYNNWIRIEYIKIAPIEVPVEGKTPVQYFCGGGIQIRPFQSVPLLTCHVNFLIYR